MADCDCWTRGPIRCAACIARTRKDLATTVIVRGERWAEKVASELLTLLSRAWPETARAREIASRWVEDLSRDCGPELHAEFIDMLVASAARRWRELQGMPADHVRRTKPAPERKQRGLVTEWQRTKKRTPRGGG